jgi:hypothetical protein
MSQGCPIGGLMRVPPAMQCALDASGSRISRFGMVGRAPV